MLADNYESDWFIDEWVPFALFSTGALTLQHQLDFESKTMYGLNITVSDNGTPPMSTITYAQIDVDDVNDNTPIFEKDSYEFTVSNHYN